MVPKSPGKSQSCWRHPIQGYIQVMRRVYASVRSRLLISVARLRLISRIFLSFVVLQFSAAVEEQMLKRGYSKSDNPDVLINISVDLKDATSAPKISRTWTSGSGVCPSYRFYNGGPRAPSSSGSMPTLCEFKEGSVRVDMVVVKLSRAMWSGVSLVRIDKDEARSNVISQRTLLSPIVADTNIMFENYPFRFHQEIDGLPKDS